jgi:hydrogenase nickel incorporation protein HypA/HybF
MHEWALAEGVVQTANRIAEEQGLNEIFEITIKIGELQQVEHEILEFAMEQLRTPIMKNAKFTLESVPGRLKCRICNEEWVFSPRDMEEDVPEVAHVYVSCPSCGSPDFQVIEGRGVILASIRGVKDDD